MKNFFNALLLTAILYSGFPSMAVAADYDPGNVGAPERSEGSGTR